MQDMNDGTLSTERYPSVVPMPDEGSSSGTAASARNRQSITGSARRDNPMRASRWARESTKPAKRNAYSGARQIVFMAGGLCYSEIRSVYDLVHVLRSAKPGQRVPVWVVRGDKRVKVMVTYGTSRRRR